MTCPEKPRSDRHCVILPVVRCGLNYNGDVIKVVQVYLMTRFKDSWWSVADGWWLILSRV